MTPSQSNAPAHCLDCGYDRSGLPDTPDVTTPCPECGGTDIGPPWQGWWIVFAEAIVPAWAGAMLMVGVPAVLVRLAACPSILLLFGSLATLGLIALAPFVAADRGVTMRGGPHRPGKLHLALVGLGYTTLGCVVIVGVTVVICALL
ncbi:MAG: hypothetical protein R3B68_08000 [Phycisphaerales bacterium]